MAELVDALDSGSSERSCEFESHWPHHEWNVFPVFPKHRLQGFFYDKKSLDWIKKYECRSLSQKKQA